MLKSFFEARRKSLRLEGGREEEANTRSCPLQGVAIFSSVGNTCNQNYFKFGIQAHRERDSLFRSMNFGRTLEWANELYI